MAAGTADGATGRSGAGAPAIRTRGLTKRYGEFTAVDRLDLEVWPGEIFGLLGPNGAGKTTTILMLLGLSEPSEGHAEVAGLDPTRQPLEVKRRVGYMPDNVGFYGTLTGRQNLWYTARLNGLREDEARARIDGLLEQVGLTEAADGRVDTYSRGMRQRLGIADALVKEPEILILDEPTVAIDPEGVADVLALVRFLAHDRGVALLLSSHLLHQVQSVCDRVGIFVEGRMVAQGPMDELAERLSAGSIVLEVGAGEAGDGEDAATIIRSVSGVESVEPEGRDPGMWVVTATTDVRSDIAGALQRAGIPVWHLRRRGQELDDLYRRYFHQEVTVG
jgi:ABC-2 type transport system ATP-binding protein